MRNAWIPCLWLIVSLICPAAEIVAWKIPLSAYLNEGLKSPGITRLEKAPEASPFFGPTDVLWDMKEATPYNDAVAPPQPEWIVWNATSGRIVAKASWKDLWKIHAALDPEFLEMTRCRVSLEVLESVDSETPPPDGNKPLMKVEFLARSASTTEGRWGDSARSLHYKAETTTFDPGRPWIYLGLTLTASLPDQPELLVNTDLVLVPGKPLWVARDVYAGKTLDLMASATNVLLDGDSLDQRIMIQKGDATVTMVTGRPGEELIECGDSGWLAILDLPDEFLMHNPVFGDGQPEIPDPFANESPKKMRSRFDEKAITPPPALKPWVDHEMVDIKSRFAVAMPAANDEGLMVGCDPIRKKIYLHGRSRELVESIREQFLNLLPGLDDGPQPMVATTINGREVTRLVTRAHQIGKLVRQAGKNNERRHVELEPNPGDGRDLLDLKMYYEDKPDHGTSLLLNSNPTLRNGSVLQIVSGESSGGDASSLRVSCEVIDVPGK